MLADFLAFLPALLGWGNVVIAVPLTVIVALRLWRRSLEYPAVRTLRDRAYASTALATIVVVFAAIFINNGLTPPFANVYDTQIITRGVLLVVASISALHWLRLERSTA